MLLLCSKSLVHLELWSDHIWRFSYKMTTYNDVCTNRCPNQIRATYIASWGMFITYHVTHCDFNKAETLFISYTELVHRMTITPSSSYPVSAGSSLTLNCTVVSDRVPRLTWVGPNGAVVTGKGITVLPQTDDGRISTIILTFSSIRTSHAGYYNCTSEVTEAPTSTTWDAYLVSVQSKSVC